MRKYRIKQTDKREFYLQRKRCWFLPWRTYHEERYNIPIKCYSIEDATRHLNLIIEHETTYPKYHVIGAENINKDPNKHNILILFGLVYAALLLAVYIS